MRPAARGVAGFVALLALVDLSGALMPAYGDVPHVRAASAAQRKLTVTIETLTPTTLKVGQDLTVLGTVANKSDAPWTNAKAYLQISPDPATTLEDLDEFARTSADTGLGSPILAYGDYDTVGNLLPGDVRSFTVTVPFEDLPITGDAGVYRIGIKVIASTSTGLRDPTDGARAHTLIPLLPPNPGSMVPVQTVTLLPLTAPVKRLLNGPFADDSLARSISFGGRLYDVLAWALGAPADTVQVVVDPALLAAVRDMADGYRIQAVLPLGKSLPGVGRLAAASWLADYGLLQARQHVLQLPWGVPAANSLMAAKLPGPIAAAIHASAGSATATTVGPSVAGWLEGGNVGIQTLSVMRRAGADVEIVSQSSLAGLNTVVDSLPSLVTIKLGARRVPVLVTATKLGGFVTQPTTSALEFRQRLVADAVVRSLSGQVNQIRVTALPLGWDPGPTTADQSLTSAFDLPMLIAQSAIGAAIRPARLYTGGVQARPGPTSPLRTDVVAAIRALHNAGGHLAAILRPAAAAQSEFQHIYAMAGSTEWRTFPLLGVTLIGRRAATASASLAKVTVTGPPFVAMSSASGRFPLTITNGLDQAITVRLEVIPTDKALKIAPLTSIDLPANQRRDIQVVSTAEGSGVTSVQARLSTSAGAPFGRPWTFDVRATQIGLVIWVVMGVGGGVLFIAAGYRIVNRLRGHQPPPRRNIPA